MMLNGFSAASQQKWPMKKTIMLYTGIFLALIVAIYSYFWINGISFIWQSDGFTQHYLLFKDYAEILKNFLRHPLEGIPMWDWTNGLGADMIQSYGYYVIGDPFAYLGVFFPEHLMEFAFHFLILLRVYCIGLAFLFFARKIGLYADGGLFGSIVYTFTFYVILNVTRHPFFLTPMIFLPLLCLGMEKMLRNESNRLFILVVFISAVSNFYFFYMLTLLVFIYALVRYFYMNGFISFKHLFQYVWRALYSYVIGLLLSAVVLVPIIWGFLHSSREASEFAGGLSIYPLQYYIVMVRNLFIPDSYLWTVMGFASVTILILPLFITRRKWFSYLPWILSVFLVMLLLPAFGSIMNGMSGPFNRWSFAIPLFLGLAAGRLYDHRFDLRKNDLKMMGFSLAIFLLVAVLERKVSPIRSVMFAPILCAAGMWLLLIGANTRESLTTKRKKMVSLGLFLLLSLNLVINAMDYYYPSGQNTVETLLDYGTADQTYEQTFDGAENVIPQVDRDVFRMGLTAKDRDIRNHLIYLDRMGMTSYLSITNGYVAEFSRELESGAFQLIQPVRNGFDDRRIINHLLGVRYIVTPVENENYLPEGYQVIHRTTGEHPHLVAETQEAYPFAYANETYLSTEDFEKLNPVEKDAFLSYGVVVDEKETDVSQLQPFDQDLGVKELPFDVIVEDSSLDTVGNNKVRVKDREGSFELSVKNQQELENAEIYVHLEGLHYHPEQTDSIAREKTSYTANVAFGQRNKSIFQSDELSFSTYMFRDKMLFNLGYQEKVDPDEKFVITFDEPGLYELDNITIYALPKDPEYQAKVAEKKEHQLQLTTFENDRIEGTIDQQQPAILTTSIPYGDGWKATVNGKKVDTIKTNIGFVGIPLTAGHSEVVLTYRTPFLLTGLALTVIGLLLFIANERYWKQKKITL